MLWSKLYGCKSIGRVQSISIFAIFELEQKIRNFISTLEYKFKISYQNITISRIVKDNQELKSFESIDEAIKEKKRNRKKRIYF